MSTYEEIRAGLEEAIVHETGTGEAKTVRWSVEPVRQWNADEIKKIRLNAGMTQALFAEVMGVSLKAVEAWEVGRNTPAGSAGRMLFLMQQDPMLPQKMNIVHNATLHIKGIMVSFSMCNVVLDYYRPMLYNGLNETWEVTRYDHNDA